MSAQTMAQVWAPILAEQRQRVYAATWGHLAPRRNKRYHGTILFALGNYGDYVVLRSDLAGLDDSPWFFDAQQDFVEAQPMEAGGIYRFTGYFCNYSFVGKVERLDI